MGQSKLSVTPLASLCLGVVRGWSKVASKGKGGQNFGDFLSRKSIRSIWKSICAEARAEGVESVHYS